MRLLFFHFAERLEQGKGVIGQGDGFAVISVLLAFDPAGILETADEVGGVFLLGLLASNRNWV